MTLESNLSKVVFNGNGAATEFPFTFKVWDAGQIAVTVSGPDGYAEDVTAGAAIVLDADAGGTVTYLQDGAPLPSGYKLAITRNMPFLQRVDLISATRFDPQVMEDALDTATAERQELREKVDRAVLVDATDARTPAEYSRDFWAAHDDVLTARDNVEEMLRETGTEVGTHSYVTSSGSTTARTLGDRFADVINVKDFGAKGDGVTDDTAAINAAIEVGIANKKKVFIPNGKYVFSGYVNKTAQGLSLEIEGDMGSCPTLVAPESSVSFSTWSALCVGMDLSASEDSAFPSTITELTITSSIHVGDTKIPISSTTGIHRGMMIQISSNRLWYHGDREVYRAGEIHKVTSVDSQYVYIEDFVRDEYSANEVENVRVWEPNHISIKNINFEIPLSPTGVTQRALVFAQCDGLIVENIKIDTVRTCFVTNSMCWNSRISNLTCHGSDALDENLGYGIRDKGSVGTIVEGLKAKGIRRAYDACSSTQSDQTAAICRDAQVYNFVVDGGGYYFPASETTGWGVGTHGGCEGITFRDGILRCLAVGINSRGRNIRISNVIFEGKFKYCIGLTEGAGGLLVSNCSYNSYDYPNKTTDGVAGGGSSSFVQIGLPDAPADLSLPIVLANNTCFGLIEALVSYQANAEFGTLKNLSIMNNYVECNPGSGNIFNLLKCRYSNTPISGIYINGNFVYAKSGSWAIGQTAASVYTDVASYLDGTYRIVIETNKVGKVYLPHIGNRRRTILTVAMANTGEYSFIIRDRSTTITQFSHESIPSTIVATDSGSSLTGTTGTEGNLTFGLEDDVLYIENRLSSYVAMTIQAIS